MHTIVLHGARGYWSRIGAEVRKKQLKNHKIRKIESVGRSRKLPSFVRVRLECEMTAGQAIRIGARIPFWGGAGIPIWSETRIPFWSETRIPFCSETGIPNQAGLLRSRLRSNSRSHSRRRSSALCAHCRDRLMSLAHPIPAS